MGEDGARRSEWHVSLPPIVDPFAADYRNVTKFSVKKSCYLLVGAGETGIIAVGILVSLSLSFTNEMADSS
jgi:hypothetical protein